MWLIPSSRPSSAIIFFFQFWGLNSQPCHLSHTLTLFALIIFHWTEILLTVPPCSWDHIYTPCLTSSLTRVSPNVFLLPGDCPISASQVARVIGLAIVGTEDKSPFQDDTVLLRASGWRNQTRASLLSFPEVEVGSWASRREGGSVLCSPYSPSPCMSSSHLGPELRCP
jgi:hypothetical protein